MMRQELMSTSVKTTENEPSVVTLYQTTLSLHSEIC